MRCSVGGLYAGLLGMWLFGYCSSPLEVAESYGRLESLSMHGDGEQYLLCALIAFLIFFISSKCFPSLLFLFFLSFFLVVDRAEQRWVDGAWIDDAEHALANPSEKGKRKVQ